MISYEMIVEVVRELTIESLFILREDVLFALEQAYEQESEPVRSYLELLLYNAEVAQNEGFPLFHDVGIPSFFIELGEDVEFEGPLQAALDEGVRQAILKHPTREVICKDPLNPNSFSSDPTPVFFFVEKVPGSQMKIICMRSSAGAEFSTQIKVLPFEEVKSGIKDFVIETVRKADVIPSPPLVVGIGIGGRLENVVTLAKKALLRPVGKPHHSLEYARLEQDLLAAVNELEIGPGGLGGNFTALSVHVELAPAQAEAIPIAISLQSSVFRTSEHSLFDDA